MVHGFGAESGYYASQLEAVAKAGVAAYAVDLLGQGRSWPSKDPAPSEEPSKDDEEATWGWGDKLDETFEPGLKFGEPAWLDQLTAFVREAVPEERVYLLGNSLGGYLAAKMAARESGSPGKVRGLILANATPFWGWTREGLTPWDGRLPAPGWTRPLATAWFGALRGNIESLLGIVYAMPDNDIVRGALHDISGRIADAASHPMGAAAFASILFAPQQEPSFGDALDTLAGQDLPMLLLYGEDDPWILPWWAERAARRVDRSGEYYAISPAGHCPHHEAPAAFNRVLVDWLRRAEGKSPGAALLAVGESLEGPAHEVGPTSATCSTVTERRL